MDNIALKLEINFYNQTEGSVLVKYECDDEKKILGELLLLSAYTIRSMLNIGYKKYEKMFADSLKQISSESMKNMLESNFIDAGIPFLADLVDYKGVKGDKGFNATLDYSEHSGDLGFKCNCWGFGFMAKGMAYYAPLSTFLLLKYLAQHHSDNHWYILNGLMWISDWCAEAYLTNQLTVFNQLECARLIANKGYSLYLEAKLLEEQDKGHK